MLLNTFSEKGDVDMTKNRTRIAAIAILTGLFALAMTAQESRMIQPRWWFGGGVGLNFNYYGGTTALSVPNMTAPGAYTKGSGTGLWLAPLIEYRPDPVWGAIATLGYDNRSGEFDAATNAGVVSKVKTSMNYLSLEPSLKISPFPSNVYFFAGPRLGFNVAKSFTYTEEGTQAPAITGDWSAVRGTVLGLQLGAGYDIPLTSADQGTRIDLAPSLGVHFGQGPRSEDDWSLTSVRFSLAVKFGSTMGMQEALSRDLQFSVRAPRLIPTERRVKETFPMRNFVFFEEGSSAVPSRYVQLTREQASAFREEQLVQPEPKDLTGRSRRQLTVYHNILNILGDRMRNHPDAKVTLSGSSDKGAATGKLYAESIKSYLVDLFGIDGGRITTVGRERPEIPSVVAGASRELDLVRPEDRRVDITSAAFDLLEPVQIVSLQEDPLDSDVLLTVTNAPEMLASWSVEVTDENGVAKRFGPFTGEQERVGGRQILGDRVQGKYTIALLAQTKSGQTVRKEEPVRLVRSDEPVEDLGLRFSILFDFDQSRTVATYERFLTDVVAPLVPDGGSVIIHGHTDIIGEESHNLKLSKDRAEETKATIERALTKAGKRRVKFDAYGFGEDLRRAPFENTLPEERFYNRTVIIDILPE
jgi:outer membrane protein OmpA-like peptidoglycan-associated protein